MIKKIAALSFIFICTSCAWLILGATIFARTEAFSGNLKDDVSSSWGTAQEQQSPSALWTRTYTKPILVEEFGKKVQREVEQTDEHFLPLESSDIKVGFDLEHRQKGLLWYSTYKVSYAGAYEFVNDTAVKQQVRFRLRFPSEQAIYDDLVFLIDDQQVATQTSNQFVSAVMDMEPGQRAKLNVGYRSQGLDRWRYNFGENVTQVRNFNLAMTTNFKDIDFPENTLSPSEKRETGDGWQLAWNYRNLVSGYQIGMAMPEKLQPGPLAGKISLFAPVSLFFFFFLIFMITTLRGIDLHPMNYFFLAAAFFAFHLLLAYLVDHISIHLAFLICSAVSIFLVVSYLRLVVGLRFALVEAGLTQFVYLVLFSYAFFFKGFTGLAITVGSILTLFVVMQATGRVRWEERFTTNPVKASV